MIRRNIPLILIILIMVSCRSKKAADLKAALEQKNRTIFNVMVGKNGPSEQKLECLIDGDFKCALLAIDEEEQVFNKVISEINAMQTNDIKQGNALKTASIEYYKAVKALEITDRLAIAQQEISQNKSNSDKVRDAALDKQLQLSRDKLEMHKTISKKEQLLEKVQKRFDAANNLD